MFKMKIHIRSHDDLCNLTIPILGKESKKEIEVAAKIAWFLIVLFNIYANCKIHIFSAFPINNQKRLIIVAKDFLHHK